MNRTLLTLSVVALVASPAYAVGPSATVTLEAQYVNGEPGQDYAAGDGILAEFEYTAEVPADYMASVQFGVGIVVTDAKGNQVNPETGFTFSLKPNDEKSGTTSGGYTIPMYGNAGPYTITCTVSYFSEPLMMWMDLDSTSCEFFLFE